MTSPLPCAREGGFFRPADSPPAGTGHIGPRAVRAALEGLEGIFLSVPVCCLPDGRYVPPRRGRCLGVTCMVAVMEEPAAAPCGHGHGQVRMTGERGCRRCRRRSRGKRQGRHRRPSAVREKIMKKPPPKEGGGPSCEDGRGKRQRGSGRGQAGQGRQMLGDPAGTLLGRLLAGVTAQGGVVVVEGLALIKNVG